MAGFGLGIGSFMDGIERGKAAVRAQNAADAATAQQAFQNDLATKNMGIAQDANTRAGAASTLALAQGNQNLSQGATTFQNQQADRTANLPLVDATRAAGLNTLQGNADVAAAYKTDAAAGEKEYADEQAEHLKTTTDPNSGQSIFTMDGTNYPTKADAQTAFDQDYGDAQNHYYNIAAPSIAAKLRAKGDFAGADAFEKAHTDSDFQRGVSDLGRLQSSAKIGDWAGVNHSLQNISDNNGYMNLAGYDVSVSPTKDANGVQNGVTLYSKNKATGEVNTKQFNDMQDLYSTLSGIISPEAAVAHNKAISDNAASAAAALAAKKGDAAIEQEKQINVGAALGVQNRLTERDKRLLPETLEERAKNIQAAINGQNAGGGFPPVTGADGKQRDMTEKEIYDSVAQSYDENRRLSGLPSAGGATASAFGNGAPILSSRPDAPPPTPRAPTKAAPVSRGVLEARDALASAQSSGPGSVKPWWEASQPLESVARGKPGSSANYEARMGLANVPSNGPAPMPYVPPMPQGPKAPAPMGGEGVDAYEQRLGLAPTPPARPPVVIDNTPQGRSAQQYADSLRLSAADQIAQDAKKRRLTAAQRGW